jgi:hypothetical protein
LPRVVECVLKFACEQVHERPVFWPLPRVTTQKANIAVQRADVPFWIFCRRCLEIYDWAKARIAVGKGRAKGNRPVTEWPSEINYKAASLKCL